jgi:putative MFS transporter
MSPDSEDTKNGTYGVLSVATIISLGGFLDGFNLVALSAVLPFVSASFDITSAGIKGLLVGTVFLGGIPGAIILGSMSSRYGRREIFLYDILLFIVGSIVTFAAPNLGVFAVGRFISGFAIGGDNAVAWIMLSEMSQSKRRGTFIGYPYVLWGIAGASTFLITILLLPYGDLAWRILFAISVIPSIIVLIVRRTLPESPRWLASHGQIDLALDISKRLGLDFNQNNAIQIKESKYTWKLLFSRKFLSTTLLVFAVIVFTFYIIIPANLFTPTVMGKLGFEKTVTLGLLAGALVWIVNLSGFGFGGVFGDRTGRKRGTYIYISILLFVSLVLVLFGKSNFYLFLGLWMAIEFFGTGQLSMSTAWIFELFPTRMRGIAGGWGQGANRFIGFAGSYIIAELIVLSDRVLFLSLFFAALIVLLIAKFGIKRETVGIKLEDLNELREMAETL